MIKDNFKRSLLAAALITTGSIFAATSAQATIVDLINGNSGTINGAIFDYTNAQPTGTGFINSFLRVQKDGTEHITLKMAGLAAPPEPVIATPAPEPAKAGVANGQK